MDPVQTEDGKPYGPQRYQELVKERYLIAKNTNTSYIDTGKITPTERKYIIKFLHEEAKKHQEMLDDAEQKRNNS